MLKYSTILFFAFIEFYPYGVLSKPVDFVKKLREVGTLVTEIAEKLQEPPESFERIGSKFYYIETIQKKNWFSARNTCRRMGGNLANIQNSEELIVIKRHAKINREEHYWLDITDLADEGQFVSSTTGESATFLKWAWTDPNNLNGVEDCVDLYRDLMQDDNCKAKKYYFICEAGN
ncbi:C-type lectin 37Db-like [Drosophila gunungcola]|uniref:C-type lectin 37Db-like n=1 Tax=Drosophila gunungcola TaxID=103775 RepID=UPI0022E1155B|nr:C-type lectin 37Db-like [Drosophila gunungcola]